MSEFEHFTCFGFIPGFLVKGSIFRSSIPDSIKEVVEPSSFRYPEF